MYVIDAASIVDALSKSQVTLGEMLDKLIDIPQMAPVYEWLLQHKLNYVYPTQAGITPELRKCQVSLNYNIFD